MKKCDGNAVLGGSFNPISRSYTNMKKCDGNAVLGGSFNPPTYGHAHVIIAALRRFATVTVVPCGSRTDKSILLSHVDRIKMVREYCWELFPSAMREKRLLISENESERPALATWELMNEMGANIYFIIGRDLVPTLHRWRYADKLCELRFAVINRAGEIHTDVSGDSYLKNIDFTDLPSIITSDISSTLVRTQIKTIASSIIHLALGQSSDRASVDEMIDDLNIMIPKRLSQICLSKGLFLDSANVKAPVCDHLAEFQPDKFKDVDDFYIFVNSSLPGFKDFLQDLSTALRLSVTQYCLNMISDMIGDTKTTIMSTEWLRSSGIASLSADMIISSFISTEGNDGEIRSSILRRAKHIQEPALVLTFGDERVVIKHNDVIEGLIASGVTERSLVESVEQPRRDIQCSPYVANLIKVLQHKHRSESCQDVLPECLWSALPDGDVVILQSMRERTGGIEFVTLEDLLAKDSLTTSSKERFPILLSRSDCPVCDIVILLCMHFYCGVGNLRLIKPDLSNHRIQEWLNRNGILSFPTFVSPDGFFLTAEEFFESTEYVKAPEKYSELCRRVHKFEKRVTDMLAIMSQLSLPADCSVSSDFDIEAKISAVMRYLQGRMPKLLVDATGENKKESLQDIFDDYMLSMEQDLLALLKIRSRNNNMNKIC